MAKGESAKQPMFKCLSLIGVGLIGSSISHAARRGGLIGEIVGCTSTPENSRQVRGSWPRRRKPMPIPSMP